MDLFKEWCGRCVVLDPMYKRLTVELDDWDKRVAFLAVRAGSGGCVGPRARARRDDAAGEWRAG